VKHLAKVGGAVRYASRTTGFDFEKWLTWAAVAGVAYVGYQVYSTVKGVKGALNSVGSAIGSGLYDLFHPNEGKKYSLQYRVKFPDGKDHYIFSDDIDKSGRFTWNGRRYQMLVDKGKQTGTNKYATPVG